MDPFHCFETGPNVHVKENDGGSGLAALVESGRGASVEGVLR